MTATTAPNRAAKIEPPLYRAKATCWFGCTRVEGDEFSTTAWPNGYLEPVNETARKIFRYWATHQGVPLPHSPFEDGRLSLPGEDDAKPRWLALKDAFLDGAGIQYQSTNFDCVTWPRLDAMRPLNEPAKQVVAYLESLSELDRRRLPYRAWDVASQRVNKLPEHQPGTDAASTAA